MSLFKNEIGRPSNDILRTRRNIKIIIALIVIAIVAGGTYLVYNYVARDSVSGVSKNISSSGAEVSIAGKNGGFIVNNKYYSKGTYVPVGSNVTMSTFKDNVGSAVVLTASNGKTTINIKGSFGKEFTKKINGANSKMIIQTLNSSGKVISSKTINITKNSVIANLTVSSNVHSIKIGIMKQTSSGVSQVYNKIINVSTIPTISQSFVDPASKNSSGIYVVSKNGTNRVKFNLNLTSGQTMYYSVFTYKGHSLTSSNLDKRNTACVAFNKSITTPTYSLNVKEPLSISVRIYADLNTCKNDSNAKAVSTSTSRPFVSETVVKYSPKYTTTNSDKYVVIDPHYATGISNNIGHQSSGDCLEYALKYGAYVLKGSVSKGYGNNGPSYGATRGVYTNKTEFFKLIVDKINQGIPVVLHTGNKASATHWVTVIGYKPNKNGTTDIDNLWIIDPWNNDQYNKKGSGTVFFGESRETIYVKDKNGKIVEKKGKVRTTMTRGLNGDRVYFTWASRSSVK